MINGKSVQLVVKSVIPRSIQSGPAGCRAGPRIEVEGCPAVRSGWWGGSPCGRQAMPTRAGSGRMADYSVSILPVCPSFPAVILTGTDIRLIETVRFNVVNSIVAKHQQSQAADLVTTLLQPGLPDWRVASWADTVGDRRTSGTAHMPTVLEYSIRLVKLSRTDVSRVNAVHPFVMSVSPAWAQGSARFDRRQRYGPLAHNVVNSGAWQPMSRHYG